jgi:hypothetical protein
MEVHTASFFKAEVRKTEIWRVTRRHVEDLASNNGKSEPRDRTKTWRGQSNRETTEGPIQTTGGKLDRQKVKQEESALLCA